MSIILGRFCHGFVQKETDVKEFLNEQKSWLVNKCHVFLGDRYPL